MIATSQDRLDRPGQAEIDKTRQDDTTKDEMRRYWTRRAKRYKPGQYERSEEGAKLSKLNKVNNYDFNF